MQFFRLTRKKIKLTIIFTLLLGLSYFIYTVFVGIFGLSLTSLCLPAFTDDTTVPSSFPQALKIANARCQLPGYNSAIVQFIIKAEIASAIAGIVLVSYLLACFVISRQEKSKKQKSKK